ncbi:hexose-6-phosphate:phosphate antiporter [Aeromonas enteropelogenes]|uniref:hexose-6-phosphate:phosphate antiporter n=1 Tax=Aeromonas enteropelogenes TaxID=29489 RepID=UPI003BA0ADA2
MTSLSGFFDIKKIPPIGLTTAEQRKLWLRQFLKAFMVVFLAYMCMYLIRNNFKAAQPFLKEDYGISTLELGYIGLAFSIVYGIGKTILGYLVDGKNTKRIISFLLISSSIVVIVMGLVLSFFGSVVSVFIVLWGLNGIFQSAGGPASYSTIYRWVPRTKRATAMGLWNSSHNIGGAIAGALALWGANTFFGGNIAGMFIFPAVIALAIGIIGLYWGKDDPGELGWNLSEEIFEEPIEEKNVAAETMTKWEIFRKYLLSNPWVWVLCCANVFGYILRIGIDNWAPLYVRETLQFSDYDAVNTILWFEAGAFIGSLFWGMIADFFKGRTAAVGTVCLTIVFFAIDFYRDSSSVLTVNIALFCLGAMIFGTLTLIPISIINLAPKRGVSVANGMAGTFGYLFGDSTAKVALALIADPKRDGLTVFGYNLHGWADVFIVFNIACVIAVALLFVVAIVEERKIRKIQKATELGLKVVNID